MTILLEKGNKVYFSVKGEVYSASKGAPKDIYGYPMGARWECYEAAWPTLLKLLTTEHSIFLPD